MTPLEEKTGIKFISLNIERDRHYETVLPFLKFEAADVVCLQEVLDRDMERFRKELGMEGLHVSIAKADKGRETEALAKAGVGTGTAIFSRFPLEDTNVLYFYGAPGRIPSRHDPLPDGRFDHSHGVLLTARVTNDGVSYRIGTTHFTWTPDGSASSAQRADMARLLGLLSSFSDIVLCGDFNAPRGGEIWETLASRYQDNIPASYRVSLDPNLHSVPNLPYLVDGLFSTPEYRCTDTRIQCGVSDHCAVVSTIKRTS